MREKKTKTTVFRCIVTLRRLCLCYSWGSVFGVSSSPFHLMATTRHHTNKYRDKFPKIVGEIQRSLFVDDLNTGADSVSEGHELLSVSKRVFKEGGFNLRKFATNSTELHLLVESDEALADSTIESVKEASYQLIRHSEK